MSSNESAAYEIMTNLNVDYVLVIFGGVIGYSGDDINKFLWMVRIAEGEHPQDIRESDYFTERGEFRVDEEGSPTLLNCLMYKLSYYRYSPRNHYHYETYSKKYFFPQIWGTQVRLPHPRRLRPHPQRRHRAQGLRPHLPGGGLHVGTLASPHLQVKNTHF